MELRDYLPHVEYEARMLIHSARQLSQYPDYDEMVPGSIDKADHDVYLESFLIHARVIHEFFVPKKPSRPDDIRAWQICPALKISNTKARGHPVLDCDVETRINKQLAHPTMTRVNAKRPFPIREIATEAAISLLEFFAELDDPNYEQLRRDLTDFSQDDDTVIIAGS